ncbi:helix-turn-helix transcriptional regulator [Novosphingobium piscinae]|uniref:Helix-turn-helix transcriptional regulator n=1 Tax=Novosphingobium piscinae TaxID=1507448 RepID=A0A7X1FVW7_9SPHN|nr:helix-turn-helix transcriptional regulator [Novosphingobium piscinae]MBC2667921.1 helix-turn-helix transcriptional regulator [Novosphingobium piscinae]
MKAPKLIEQIYEAAVLPDRWPAVLQDVADHVGARGCLYLSKSPERVEWQASHRSQQQVEDYIAAGWPRDPALSAPYVAEQWPGFRTETDYRSEAEIAALPVHREFFLPRGLSARMATVIQGAGDTVVQIAVQGFASHDAARAAVPWMDQLRPHLARALSLSALVTARSQIVVDSLALAGIAAAVITPAGRLKSANAAFLDRMADRMADHRGVLRFVDPFLQGKVDRALAPFRTGRRQIQSIAVTAPDPAEAFVIHLLPVVGAAREVCDSDGVVMLLADPRNRSLPAADLLRLLFDLTPAEARLARLVAEGFSAPQAAVALGIQANTARAHLKAVFAKTGFARQSELALALAGLGMPGAAPVSG